MALSVRLIDAPVTTYWLFTSTPTVKRDEVDGEDEGKRGEREKKKERREPVKTNCVKIHLSSTGK